MDKMVSSRGVLPTRKNRAAKEEAAKQQSLASSTSTATAENGTSESRQMSHTAASDRQGRNADEVRMDYNNSSSNLNEPSKQQTFVMDDIPTIDTSTMPPAYDRNPPSRRGASPSIITSRRGRSRSPVGYNNNTNNAAASRPSSRNGSAGRPRSRNDNISSAAFAAGEAAAGVMDPYGRSSSQSHHHHPHNRARSPSPVNRFPALDLSFEMSPQQSMSFMGDGSSFDWNAGSGIQQQQQQQQQQHQLQGRRSPSPTHHHQQHYHQYGRSSSPLHASRASSRNSQALFPEHQILSASRSREYFGNSNNNHNNNNSNTHHNPKRERRTIRSPSPNPNRSSVFRGSPPSNSAANRLPAELMLALDDTPPSSPMAVTTPATTTTAKKGGDQKSNNSAPSSTTNNNTNTTTIDKELSATQDVAFENIQFDGIMPEGDYLANLSLRKSYDLEQVFSFMNENKEGSKDPMKLGTSSFANYASQLMCSSNEVGDRTTRQQQGIANQNSNIELSPIQSFNEAQGVDQVDGVELGKFLQSAPTMQEDQHQPPPPPPPQPAAAEGQYWSSGYNNSSSPPEMNTHTPPSYNNVYTDERNINKYVPSAGPGPTIPTLGRACLATTMQVKVSTRHTVHPTVNLSCKNDFYVLLRKLAPAFAGFRFTLPEMNGPPPPSSANGKEGFKSTAGLYRPTERQMVIARRRVNSSVCAFGGVLARRVVSFDASREDVKNEMEEKRKYDENLSMRYFMKENCVSWDVELHEVIKPKSKKAKTSAKSKGPATPKVTEKKGPLASPYCVPITPKSPGEASNDSKDEGSPGGDNGKGKKGKTKYRCKLCGLPKQNHVCPYKAKVVRSIGTQVYPAVNAFVSNEPGLLAPALSEMNNSASMMSRDLEYPSKPAGHIYRMPYNGHSGPITPDSHWSPTTPGGLSTMSSSCDPGTPRTPNSPYSNNFRKRDYAVMSRTMTHTSTPGGYSTRSKPQDPMFRDIMMIKMDQFRTVRVNPAEKVVQPYQYPLVPTPYDQRKEMGDALFALSKEVPSLADSCANILREARERDEWDQAVAELTTQVLVVLKCEDDDHTLEGLMKHLNGLGIAC